MEIKMTVADQRHTALPVVEEKWNRTATSDIEISGQTSVRSVRLTMDDEESARFAGSPCRRSDGHDGGGCEHFCVEALVASLLTKWF